MSDISTTRLALIEILLVEDSLGDARLAKEALKGSKIINTIHHVKDGVEAMAFLRKKGAYAGVPSPDLILLDLNLPRKNGLEVLAELKADDALRHIPVVILTVSKNEEDIIKAYDRNANCFVTKPIDFQQFMKVVKSIEHFWLAIVKLPPKEG